MAPEGGGAVAGAPPVGRGLGGFRSTGAASAEPDYSPGGTGS